MTADDSRSLPHLNETQRLCQRIAELEASVKQLVKKEARFQESCLRMDAIVNKLPDIVYRLDSSGTFEFINQAITAYGYSPNELKGTYVTDLVHPDDWEKVSFHIIERSTEERSTRDFEVMSLTRGQKIIPSTYTFKFLHKTGIFFWMQAHSVRIEWEGNPATLTLLRDITEQKKLEAQLLQTQKMEAIGTLAGGIAHDFNNILQAISGYAQILAMSKTDSDPEFRKLEMILRSTQRGSELIKRLLTFSRKLESKLMPLNINSEVHQVCNILERTIPKMIRIKLDPEEPIHNINADTVLIEQIMMNISFNARDAMPEGGELTFSTRNIYLNDQFCNILIGARPAHYALLAISDTRVGIDSDTLTHIFEPFYTTKKPGN